MHELSRLYAKGPIADARHPLYCIASHRRHMGTGDNKQCFQCERGVTPEGASANSSCGHDSKFETMASALIADSPQGPWTAAPGLINGANCEPFFMPNGTLFYACPWGGKSSAPNCNGQTAFLQMARAESLEDALAVGLRNDPNPPKPHAPCTRN